LYGRNHANVFNSSGIFCTAGLPFEFVNAGYAGGYDACLNLFVGKNKASKNGYEHIVSIA
jgi:hypothetical protein